MMPNVNISNENFQRLQGLAVPLVDDLDSVLARVLEFYAQQGAGAVQDKPIPDDLTVKSFPADSPPDLTFTSIKSLLVDGEPFPNRYWNPLMFQIIGMTATKLGKGALVSLLEGNFSKEETKGYAHVPDADIWVQGRESNLCWRMIGKLAKAANIAVEVEFFWQDKPTAAYPGKSGRFAVGAK